MDTITKKLYETNYCDVIEKYSSLNINANFCRFSEATLVDVVTTCHLEEKDYQDAILNNILTKGQSDIMDYKGTYQIGTMDIPYGFMIFKSVNDAIQYCNCYRDIVGQIVAALFVPYSHPRKNHVRYTDDFPNMFIQTNNPIVLPTKARGIIDYVLSSNIFNYVHEYSNLYKHNSFIDFNISLDLLSNQLIKDVKEFNGKHNVYTNKDVMSVVNEICVEIDNVNKLLEDCITNELSANNDRKHIYSFPVYSKTIEGLNYNVVLNDNFTDSQKVFICYAALNPSGVRVFEWEYDIILVIDDYTNKNPIGYFKKVSPENKQGCYIEFEYHNNITDSDIVGLLDATNTQKVYIG